MMKESTMYRISGYMSIAAMVAAVAVMQYTAHNIILDGFMFIMLLVFIYMFFYTMDKAKSIKEYEEKW